MTSLTMRVAGAFAALATAVALAGCSSPADSAGASQAPLDAPAITGTPAGFDSDDVAFATNMVAHHKQAIELSKLVPDRSTDPDVVALANQIATEQQPEINILNVFLVQWKENPDIGSPPDAEGPAGHGQPMAGMVDDATMATLKSLHGKEFDTLFLQSMIGHHQGAVEMAKAEIANGKNVDAIAMAKMMVGTQEAEISQMKTMLEGSQP